MATITRIPFLRHCSTGPTAFVQHMTRGVVRHAGPGQAFWFRAIDATISEVPLDDRELPVLVTLRTADLQQLTAPATVTFRVADPELAARRIDFSIDLGSGVWLEQPLETIAAMLHGATAAAVVALLAADPLERALRADPTELGRRVTGALLADARIAAVGLEVVGVRFGLLRPEPDVERAMQTPARERIQQDADKATFARRALAVEREAAIGENELANQIELARRQEDLIARRGANARREAEEAAAAGAIASDAEAAKVRTVAEARADADRALGEAKAAGERARLDAYRDVQPAVLTALAMQQLAANLPHIERLTVTPDILTDVLGGLLGGGGAAGTGRPATTVER
ncbi:MULTISPECIES: SPFH domain-containing protein [unclassified Agrococcus]|uniref:SPFH domain-containing protein n=1 Tax=unclassified Agrococcus TaxID=2615065 RepID=UPI00361E703D